MSGIQWLSRVLVILGAVNWGLIGVSGFNVVSSVFGEGTTVTKVVYSLVGLAGLHELIRLTLRESAQVEER